MPSVLMPVGPQSGLREQGRSKENSFDGSTVKRRILFCKRKELTEGCSPDVH